LYCTPSYTVDKIFCFFPSRRRHTRSKRDWSSDVCSSDLATPTSRFTLPKHCGIRIHLRQSNIIAPTANQITCPAGDEQLAVLNNMVGTVADEFAWLLG